MKGGWGLGVFIKVVFILAAAFDMVHDPAVALETLVSLGFQRVLTSGCDTSALEGLPVIKRLIDQVCKLFICLLF